MKKLFTLSVISLLFVTLQAGNLPNGNQPGNMAQSDLPVQPPRPWHQHLSPASLHSGIAQPAKARSIENLEVAFRHNIDSSGIWVGVDSGQFFYNSQLNTSSLFSLKYLAQNWTNNSKTVYSYSPSGRVTGDTAFIGIGNLWRYSTLYSYGYSANGYEQTYAYYNWDTLNNRWSDDYQYIHNRNSANNDTSVIFQVGNSSGNLWMTQSKTLTYYDSKNYDTSLVTQHYDSLSNTWNNSSKKVYVFDSTGHETSISYYNWDTTQMPAAWVATNAYIYTYNNAGEDLTYIVKQAMNNMLTNVSNTINFYDQKGEDSIRVNQLWNSVDSTWENTFRYVYFYDGSAYSTTGDTDYAWNAMDSMFDAYYSSEIITYNSAHNITSDVSKTWNSNKIAFENNFQRIYTYDADNNQITYEYDDGNDSAWIPSFMDSSAYDKYNNQIYQQIWSYNNAGSLASINQWFSYFQQFSGINDVKNEIDASMYPNPTSGEVNIHFALEEPSSMMINVYDLNGRIVMRETKNAFAGNNNLTIGATEIAPGVYTVQLVNMTTRQNSVLKLVKQ